MIIFDIETGPLTEDAVLKASKPFNPPDSPQPFDPAEVKTGNMKDQAKIQAKISEAREKREKEIAEYESEVERLRSAWKLECLNRAPLSAMTGQVVAIGYKSEKGTAIQFEQEKGEIELIKTFWTRYLNCRSNGRQMIGHNIFGFDLPFLVRRSWVLGVSVPNTVINQFRFWDEKVFVDTMKIWGLGSYNEFTSLDAVSRSLGGEGKLEDVSGGMFHKLIAEDKDKAIQYLVRDLDETFFTFSRMQFC